MTFMLVEQCQDEKPGKKQFPKYQASTTNYLITDLSVGLALHGLLCQSEKITQMQAQIANYSADIV